MRSRAELAAEALAIRQRLGLSAEKFARLVSERGYDTTAGTVLNLEKEKSTLVDVYLLEAIAAAAGVQLVELLGEAPAPVDLDNVEIRRFAKVLAMMGAAEVEPHLRALELLAQELEQRNRSKGKSSSA